MNIKNANDYNGYNMSHRTNEVIKYQTVQELTTKTNWKMTHKSLLFLDD